MPKFVDKKDWEWLVKIKEFCTKGYKHDKVMPSLFDVYEETHLTSLELPVTQMANDALEGEISLTNEQIYAKFKPKDKRNNMDRHTRVSPSITSLFGGFSECQNLRKEANKAMNEAAEAKKELKDVERENKVTRHYLEKFLNTLGYNLTLKNLMNNTTMKKIRTTRK
ncbi:Serine/threonine-protein kinase TEL1 [Bienertia sinuspersici]